MVHVLSLEETDTRSASVIDIGVIIQQYWLSGNNFYTLIYKLFFRLTRHYFSIHFIHSKNNMSESIFFLRSEVWTEEEILAFARMTAGRWFPLFKSKEKSLWCRAPDYRPHPRHSRESGSLDFKSLLHSLSYGRASKFRMSWGTKNN